MTPEERLRCELVAVCEERDALKREVQALGAVNDLRRNRYRDAELDLAGLKAENARLRAALHEMFEAAITQAVAALGEP